MPILAKVLGKNPEVEPHRAIFQLNKNISISGMIKILKGYPKEIKIILVDPKIHPSSFFSIDINYVIDLGVTEIKNLKDDIEAYYETIITKNLAIVRYKLAKTKCIRLYSEEDFKNFIEEKQENVFNKNKLKKYLLQLNEITENKGQISDQLYSKSNILFENELNYLIQAELMDEKLKNTPNGRFISQLFLSVEKGKLLVYARENSLFEEMNFIFSFLKLNKQYSSFLSEEQLQLNQIKINKYINDEKNDQELFSCINKKFKNNEAQFSSSCDSNENYFQNCSIDLLENINKKQTVIKEILISLYKKNICVYSGTSKIGYIHALSNRSIKLNIDKNIESQLIIPLALFIPFMNKQSFWINYYISIDIKEYELLFPPDLKEQIDINSLNSYGEFFEIKSDPLNPYLFSQLINNTDLNKLELDNSKAIFDDIHFIVSILTQKMNVEKYQNKLNDIIQNQKQKIFDQDIFYPLTQTTKARITRGAIVKDIIFNDILPIFYLSNLSKKIDKEEILEKFKKYSKSNHINIDLFTIKTEMENSF